MLSKCFRLAPIFACLVSSAFAADREAIVNELKATYGKLDGFLIVYHSEAPGKTLEATAAMDDLSGLGIVHMVATKQGSKLEARMWNTDDDVTFIDQGRGIVRIEGIHSELKSINDLERALNATEDPVAIRLIPAFHMDVGGVFPNFIGSPSRRPSWEDLIQDAPVKEADEKTVVFSTTKYGLVSVSRETGLLIRQEIDGRNDEKRVLELKSLQINPGSDAVRKLSAQWTTHGAPSLSPMAYTGPTRLQMFQRLIDKVEKGEGDLIKLKQGLDGQREKLRQFANGALKDRPGTLAAQPSWKGLLDAARDSLIKTELNADGTKLSADDLNLLLKKKETREEVRQSIVILTSPDKAPDGRSEEMRSLLMNEIFGPSEKPHLIANGDDGKAAATLIRDALYVAYVEAVIDRKMAQYWDKDGSLD